MDQTSRSTGGLVLANTNSRVATYTSAPFYGECKASPAALYLGRLAPNTRTPARYRLAEMADAL